MFTFTFLPCKGQIRDSADYVFDLTEFRGSSNLWGELRYFPPISLKKIPGLYEWFDGLTGESYYVGRATSVYDRTDQHLHNASYPFYDEPLRYIIEKHGENLKIRVWYTETAKIDEGALIRIFQPKYNIKQSGAPCPSCGHGRLMVLQAGKRLICSDCKQYWLSSTEITAEHKALEYYKQRVPQEQVEKHLRMLDEMEAWNILLNSKRGVICDVCGKKHSSTNKIAHCILQERQKEKDRVFNMLPLAALSEDSRLVLGIRPFTYYRVDGHTVRGRAYKKMQQRRSMMMYGGR